MSDPKPRLLLFDGHALIYRAYYAMPELTDPTGKLVNAVYGFSRILLTVIRDFEPEYLAVAFDHKAPTKRSEEYADYKAHRPEMPDDLKPQIEMIKDVVDALNIPRFEVAGEEADDLIGTIVTNLEGTGYQDKTQSSSSVEIVVITGDKDLLQLVGGDTTVLIPGRGRGHGDIEYNTVQVEKKMGVLPDKIVDLKALMGDSSDNIPGVRGIGKKTATILIQTFGTLKEVYEGLDSFLGDTLDEERRRVFKPSITNYLQRDRENAFLSQQLATIKCDVALKFDLEACRIADYDKSKVTELFEAYNFKSLGNLLPKDDFEQKVQQALF